MGASVTVDAQGGLAGAPERVIREGLKALKTRLPQDDWPEVVIVCDIIAMGSAVKIPGVRIVGIVAQGEDQPVVPLSVPCIGGVRDLLQCVGDEEIIIVDANEGLIYVSPDARTVIRYQSTALPEPPSRLFLESVHIPARAQDGRVVTVAGIAASMKEAEIAISRGADVIIVRFAELLDREMTSGARFLDPETEVLQTLLALAAGKRLELIVSETAERVARRMSDLPPSDQIKLLGPADEPIALSDDEVKSAVCSGADRVDVPADAVERVKNLIRSLPEQNNG